MGRAEGVNDRAGTPSTARLTVLDNVPNPFSDMTRCESGCRKSGTAKIDVFMVLVR